MPLYKDDTVSFLINLNFSPKGYHYQMKMHVFNRKHSDDADPTFTVKLLGSHNDTLDLDVNM